MAYGRRYFEFFFDCASAQDPDSLDGGDDSDRCRDGETLVSCERTIRSHDRAGRRAGAIRALRRAAARGEEGLPALGP